MPVLTAVNGTVNLQWCRLFSIIWLRRVLQDDKLHGDYYLYLAPSKLLLLFYPIHRFHAFVRSNERGSVNSAGLHYGFMSSTGAI